MAEVTAAQVRTFGLGPTADVGATDVTSQGLAGTEFTVRAPWATLRLRSGTPGRHLVPHALAALAVAERLGVGIDEAAEALAAGSHADHRMEVAEASSGRPSSTTRTTPHRSASPRRSTSLPRRRCRRAPPDRRPR